MAKTLSDFQKHEFNRFRATLIDQWAVVPATLTTMEPILKSVHKRFLSLASAATIVGYRRQRNEYAEGVVEVAHLALALATKGLENPVCVLLRQSIELVLKDIFFRSHPLEYSWAQSREDYKDLTFQFLLEFVRRTDECRKDALAATLCDRLNYWYGALSRHVHVHSACFMGYRSAGTRYRPDASHLTKLDERTAETWPILTLMLILFNPERYQRASLVERRLIQYSIPKHHLKEMRL